MNIPGKSVLVGIILSPQFEHPGIVKKGRVIHWDITIYPNTRLFGSESFKDIVSKFVFLADDRNIKNVWVSGKLVKQ